MRHRREGRAREIVHTLARDKKQDVIRKLWKMAEFEPRLREMALHAGLLATVGRLMRDEPGQRGSKKRDDRDRREPCARTRPGAASFESKGRRGRHWRIIRRV